MLTMSNYISNDQRSADLALLRRFEPVIRYTRGESFFPMDVATYVRACSLWRQRPKEDPVCLIPQGELTLEKLARVHSDSFGTIHYLKFIDPLTIAELAAYRLQDLTQKEAKDIFHAGRGRLARVGYLSRFVDAIFTLTLLARGRVPGDTAAAASQVYKDMLAQQATHCYYGRVVRQNGWIALQYWFFYAFNNWRSGFSGANDHEADWEMIYIYLYESETGSLQPEWVAYAVHDLSGDDLRRRWDDPELEKMGEHPVIYAGAGSHANYFAPGEYLTTIELPFLSLPAQLIGWLRGLWQKTIRQIRGEETEDTSPITPKGLDIFRIPFVDYARGDGLSIGSGQEREWAEVHLLDPAPNWTSNYRGLWGWYAQDPFSGENAPAGPLYNRDGTMRRSWFDPLGWSGLDKVPPPDELLRSTLTQQAKVETRRTKLVETIDQKNQALTGLALEAMAMQGQPHLQKTHTVHEEKIALLSTELKALRAQLASDEALLEALSLYIDQLRAGECNPARAHLRRAHRPATDTDLRLGRLAEAWAAISIGLMMISAVFLFLFAQDFLIVGLVAIIALFIFVEAGARKRLVRLVTSVTNALAIVASLILVYEFFWSIVEAVVLLAGVYIIWENIRELWT
jgi:hypothetical protein